MSAPIAFLRFPCYNAFMITGISTACLYGRYETEDCFGALKELGIKNCELFLRTFYEYRPDFAKKYSPRAAGINVGSVHSFSYNFEPQLFVSSLRQRGDGFYWLEQVLRSAQLFGAKAYTLHGIVRRHGGGKDDFERLAVRLNDIIDFCSGYGVALCLENVCWSLYNRPSVFKELKSRCGGLSGVLDIKQARLSGYPYAAYIEEMKGAISQVHLSDVDGNGKICLPGRGIYDFTEIFRRLKDAGFDGRVTLEVYPDSYGNLTELKQSLDLIDEIIYKIN